MVSSRASATHGHRESHLPPLVQGLSNTDWLTRDARWIAGIALVYALAVILAVLMLHPYFSQTWDVVTFTHAGHAAAGPDWAGLYAQSRAERYWPYAYPPLHALVVAPFVSFAGALPDWLLVRVPPLLADLALGLALYLLVVAKTRERDLARTALAVWLLNPLTLYNTAVQGHFEAEWLLFVVLAYWAAGVRRNLWLTSLLFAVAFLFKQNSVLFAIPYWLGLLIGTERGLWQDRLRALALSVAVFALPVALVSLPFFLYSNDYWFLIVQYVADVPLQTQSWLVGLAGLFSTDFILLRYSSLFLLLASVLVSFFALKRGLSLWTIGVLLALTFFLLSKKVVGYYYVMLLPFALAAWLPTGNYRALTVVVAPSAWISLSPYFASWAAPSHLWLYALLGALNSLLWLALAVWTWQGTPCSLAPCGRSDMRSIGRPSTLILLSAGLFVGALSAALVQPLVNNPTSPIRSPLLPPGLETNVLAALLGFIILVVVGLVAVTQLAKSFALTQDSAPSTASRTNLPRWALGLVALFMPLYFLTFTLTKESTAAFEWLLQALGR